MKLTNRQTRYLKGQAHAMKPVVSVGNKGITPNLLEEVEQALDHHELMKIKLPAGAKSDRLDLCTQIADSSKAHLVGLTGRTAIIFRQNQKGKSRYTLPQ